MKNVDFVMRTASGEVGYKESPRNSNKTKYGEAFGWNGVAWCSIFLWWCFKQNDVWFKETASVLVLKRDFESQGRFTLSNKRFVTPPQRGDIAFLKFGNSVDHVEIVEMVDVKGLFTIGGNTSVSNNTNGGMVQKRFRSWSQIDGYGRPNYERFVGKVTYEIYPTLDLNDVVSALPVAEGSYLLQRDGAVFAFGEAKYHGGANGKSYFAGRNAARIESPNAQEAQHGRIYVIVATSGERYAYPE